MPAFVANERPCSCSWVQTRIDTGAVAQNRGNILPSGQVVNRVIGPVPVGHDERTPRFQRASWREDTDAGCGLQLL